MTNQTTELTTKLKPRKTLIAVWDNPPNPNAVVWFADATAERDDLVKLLGRPVLDATPSGHPARVKRAIQYPLDILRKTPHGRFASIMRGVLVDHPQYQRVGIITHRTLEATLKQLGDLFTPRIVKSSYFGSGLDRASNDWHERCDVVIVAGTPRVPTIAVQRRLMQNGDVTSAAEIGGWGECHWKGMTESGQEMLVAGRGYKHPVWNRAHRSLVRAAIVQAAGRGRTLLDTGCDVIVISTEECGLPLIDATDIGLSETEVSVLTILATYRHKSLNSIQDSCADVPALSTAVIADRLGMKERGTRQILARLESRGRIRRQGERGGWLMI